MMIPFSIEKLSVGRPAMFQSLIFTGSPRVPVTEKSFEQGMLVSRQASTHSAVCCWQEKNKRNHSVIKSSENWKMMVLKETHASLNNNPLPLTKAF